MPILVKPLSDFNGVPSDRNPVDRRSDGFDPLIPYQMIPLGSTREMVVRTGDFKAEMSFTTPDVSSMSNFRILSQTQPNTFPFPSPNVPVRRIALPERSVVQFTLAGRSIGRTVLEGRDRPGLGAPLLQPDLKLEISVKRNESRRIAVCHVFDRINRDRGAREDFASHLAEVHNVFFEQANFSIVNIDGPSASTSAARTITLNGTIGKTFDLLDRPLMGRIIDEFDSKFPDIFGRGDMVLFSMPVPLRIKKLPKVRILGVNFNVQRNSSGRRFSVLFVGTQSASRKSTLGGARPTPTRILRHVMAHEIGHSLGLKHFPGEEAVLPPLEIGQGLSKELNPEFIRPIFHNLMFFSSAVPSDRINGNQVEVLHRKRPEFRQLSF